MKIKGINYIIPKKILLTIFIISTILWVFTFKAHSQGSVRPVPVLMNDVMIREAAYFRENGQYASFNEIPEAQADLTRIDEEGYIWFYSLEFKNDKIIGYKFQTWKDRDCDTGGQMSYFIQQKDSLRFRCSIDGTVANENDKKVE